MVSAFSVPKSKRQQKVNLNPGPGNYNPENSPKVIKPSDPNYSFGKVQRSQQFNKVPGPGSYQPNQVVINQHAPKYSMRGKKDINSWQNPTGPGYYNPGQDRVKQKSPAYSLGTKNKQFNGQSIPGPGNYQIKGDLEMINKRHGLRFARQSRDTIDKRVVPGPGSYQYQTAVFKYGSKNQPSYKIGEKLNPLKLENVPGPGSYEEKHQIYSKIGGIISRDLRGNRDHSFTPGPGNYHGTDINGVSHKQPSWTMSKSSRDQINRSNSLGPGQYQVDKQYKSYHFSNDKRIRYDDGKVPGPGQYQLNPMKSHQSIKIGQRRNDLSKSYVPGPGSYESNKVDYSSRFPGSGRYSLPKSSRDSDNKQNNPGPGWYEYNKDNSRGNLSFGKQLKLKNDHNKNPGPGQYTLKPTFADVPKYLLPDKS